MKESKKQKEKMKSMISGASIVILIAALIFLFVDLMKNKNEAVIPEESINHAVMAYKSDGSLSEYFLEGEISKEQIQLSQSTSIEDMESYENLYNLTSHNDKYYATSPSNNEVVIIKNNKIESTFGVRSTAKEIIVNDTFIVLSYLNNNNVDFYNLETQTLEKTFSLEEEVDSIAVDDKNLYVGAGDNIEIIPLASKDIDDKTTVFTGEKTISLLKSTDGYLYAGNIFASDSGNSLILKINVETTEVEGLLELGKEYPISLIEDKNNLYVTCAGLEDNVLDGVSVVEKSGFLKTKNISTGSNPVDAYLVENRYLYVAHSNGDVSAYDTNDNYTKKANTTINSVKSIIVEPIDINVD